MKLSTAVLVFSAASASAFAPASVYQTNGKSAVSSLAMGTPGMDLSGNTWKPDSEKMGVSTIYQPIS
jgi:hypothetical protein